MNENWPERLHIIQTEDDVTDEVTLRVAYEDDIELFPHCEYARIDLAALNESEWQRSQPSESTDRKLLAAWTPTHFPLYPPFINLTMIRMCGEVELTVRESPPKYGVQGNCGFARFDRDSWREFVKMVEAANKVWEACDANDGDCL
jgi:hypothetical protein